VAERPRARTALARADVCQEIALMREGALRARQELDTQGIIYPEMPENGLVKAFRDLRTRILQRTQGRNCTIVVTSLTAQSGTSFVAMNLGAVFAFDAGKTALLMDCNLRNPSMHRFLSVAESQGITDYLDDPGIDVGNIIHPVGIPRLRVVPAGACKEIPVEYFTSPRMSELLESVKQRYRERYIVLDAPPLTESADFQLLAELCDFVLLVVPYGKVTETQLQEALKSIDEKKLVGIVFNNEPSLPEFTWRGLFRNGVRGGSAGRSPKVA
jgi:exopolysaccharide/PEP-CTERM locus tyrosine autokinase